MMSSENQVLYGDLQQNILYQSQQSGEDYYSVDSGEYSEYGLVYDEMNAEGNLAYTENEYEEYDTRNTPARTAASETLGQHKKHARELFSKTGQILKNRHDRLKKNLDKFAVAIDQKLQISSGKPKKAGLSANTAENLDPKEKALSLNRNASPSMFLTPPSSPRFLSRSLENVNSNFSSPGSSPDRFSPSGKFHWKKPSFSLNEDSASLGTSRPKGNVSGTNMGQTTYDGLDFQSNSKVFLPIQSSASPVRKRNYRRDEDYEIFDVQRPTLMKSRENGPHLTYTPAESSCHVKDDAYNRLFISGRPSSPIIMSRTHHNPTQFRPTSIDKHSQDGDSPFTKHSNHIGAHRTPIPLPRKHNVAAQKSPISEDTEEPIFGEITSSKSKNRNYEEISIKYKEPENYYDL